MENEELMTTQGSADEAEQIQQKRKSVYDRLIDLLLVVIFITGFAIVAYPTFSNYWNNRHQAQVIVEYSQSSDMDEEKEMKMLEEANQYNRSLLQKQNPYLMTAADLQSYNSVLKVHGDVMAYIEIPKIKVSLPIHHGTSDAVLQVSIGHLDWTSLPTGGESTHCVLSGHRGMPNARLFTDLDKLVIGDRFMIHVLNHTLVYEVDQILTVIPTDTKALLTEEGEDFVTLVTCTPYGVNTHRLLVRGKRVYEDSDN